MARVTTSSAIQSCARCSAARSTNSVTGTASTIARTRAAEPSHALAAAPLEKPARLTATPVPTSQFYTHGRGASFEQIKGIVHEYVAIVVYWWRGWI